MANPNKTLTITNNSGTTIDSIVIFHAYDILAEQGDTVYIYNGSLDNGQTGPIVSLNDSEFHTGLDDDWYLMCNIADQETGQRLAFMNSKGWKQDNVHHSDTSITFVVKNQIDQYKYNASIYVEPGDGSSPSDFWLEGYGHGGEQPDWLGKIFAGIGITIAKAIIEIAGG